MFFFCVVFAMPLYASVFCALWSPAGKRLTSWLSFVVSYCEFVTFPLVLYRFLIFAHFITFMNYESSVELCNCAGL